MQSASNRRGNVVVSAAYFAGTSANVVVSESEVHLHACRKAKLLRGQFRKCIRNHFVPYCSVYIFEGKNHTPSKRVGGFENFALHFTRCFFQHLLNLLGTSLCVFDAVVAQDRFLLG